MIVNVVRVLIIIAALAAIAMAPLFRQTDGTTQILTDGLVVDVIAVAVIAAVAVWWWRDRRA